MTASQTPWTSRRSRAPGEHGATLIDPPASSVGRLLARNVAINRQRKCEIFGQSLNALADEARAHLVEHALKYTRAYRDVARGVPNEIARPTIFASGHQPQLFHPGVWAKNFALSRLSQQHGAIGVHLLMDSDVCRETSIRVPGGSIGRPVCKAIAFDGPSHAMAYEDRAIVDRELFGSFAQRVQETLRPLIARPLIAEMWPLAIAALESTDNLGRCLSQARHVLEGRWGASTLEIPLSEVCKSRAFLRFAAHLLVQLPTLHEVYNRSLGEFRRVKRIRSRSHPAADLARQGEWLEAPFWLFTRDDPRRRHLMVRQSGRNLVLSDLKHVEVTLPISAGGDANRAVDSLADLAPRGIRLRPRAMISTMYARLLLSDLFLHGIGGAHYDQCTDLIIRRFFAIEPPEFLVVSATAVLPIVKQTVSTDDLRRVNQTLRELRYQPERHLDDVVPGNRDSVAARLVAEKQNWIDRSASPEEYPMRHREIRRINEALQPYVADRRRELEARRDELAILIGNEVIFASREYAFCLFPEKKLRPWLLDTAAEGP